MTKNETKITVAHRKFCKDHIELHFTGFSKCRIAEEESIERIKSTSEIFDEPEYYICQYPILDSEGKTSPCGFIKEEDGKYDATFAEDVIEHIKEHIKKGEF